MKFWKNKNVFITGHTGFKGSWLSFWLSSLGANVTGYSLKPKNRKNLFDELNLKKCITKNYFADIRNFTKLKKSIIKSKANIVFHLAAQPLVLDSYKNPINTYETNVIGTANVLETSKYLKNLKSIIIVTTDKCYKNREWVYGYRETDELGGHDPYSSSKACAELVTESYYNSFFKNSIINVATVRAGNVIGGGDWSKNRIVPDILNSFNSKKKLHVRNPSSTRPWQHVIEPLSGYLKLARKLYINKNYSGSWNFGPNFHDNLTVKEISLLFKNHLPKNRLKIVYSKTKPKKHEAGLLMLDISKAKKYLNWKPKWDCQKAVEKVIEWNTSYLKKNSKEITKKQIKDYGAYL